MTLTSRKNELVESCTYGFHNWNGKLRCLFVVWRLERGSQRGMKPENICHSDKFCNNCILTCIISILHHVWPLWQLKRFSSKPNTELVKRKTLRLAFFLWKCLIYSFRDKKHLLVPPLHYVTFPVSYKVILCPSLKYPVTSGLCDQKRLLFVPPGHYVSFKTSYKVIHCPSLE